MIFIAQRPVLDGIQTIARLPPPLFVYFQTGSHVDQVRLELVL